MPGFKVVFTRGKELLSVSSLLDHEDPYGLLVTHDNVFSKRHPLQSTGKSLALEQAARPMPKPLPLVFRAGRYFAAHFRGVRYAQ